MRHVQLLPAQGWFAVFTTEEGRSGFDAPVVCFAIMELADGTTEVCGLLSHEDGRLVPAYAAGMPGRFSAYVQQG